MTFCFALSAKTPNFFGRDISDCDACWKQRIIAMVQSLGTAGVEPTEQSPLLIKTSDTTNGNGAGVTYVSIAEVTADGSINGNGGMSKKTDDADEESLGSGEVERGISRVQVARIISVLLIGSFFLFLSSLR